MSGKLEKISGDIAHVETEIAKVETEIAKVEMAKLEARMSADNAKLDRKLDTVLGALLGKQYQVVLAQAAQPVASNVVL